jgi:hypothetical protein
MNSPERARPDMGEARDPRLGVGNEGNRATDFTQRPQREREKKHLCHAPVLPEAERQIVVAPGLERSESPFEMLARFQVLSSEPVRGSRNVLSDCGLRGIGPRLDVVEEGLRVL